jgi:hypothetical protein
VKKRLILHAGIHRTGTTSIQQALFYNAASLLRAGILYPKPMDGSNAINHQRLAWDISERQIELPELSEWAASLAQIDAHTVILSAEDFCRIRNLDFLECFSAHFEIEVAMYLRRQDIWVNSWYNQHVKWPFDPVLSRCTPQQFLGHLPKFHWLNYFNTLERWCNAIGRDRTHIGILEKGQIQDPLADLCEFCGVDFVLEQFSNSRANESLPAEQISILRGLGMARYGTDIRNKIIQAVSKLPGSSDSNVYPRALRRLILERYGTGNQMVAEQFLGRTDRILFRDNEFSDISSRENLGPSEDQLICFARNLIDEFCEKAKGDKSKTAVPAGNPRSSPE